MTQIQETEKQEKALPYEAVNEIKYIGVWNTDQVNEIWIEIETKEGCYSGPIMRL